jgi:hypothetical protein
VKVNGFAQVWVQWLIFTLDGAPFSDTTIKGNINYKIPKGDVMRVNDNFETNQKETNTMQANPTQPANQDIADYIRGLATDLERLSQEAGLNGVAACLRAAATEARRAKNDARLLKLGVTPDRRLG